MTRRDEDPISEALRDEAAAWLMRVQSDAATDQDWAALTSWLAGSQARHVAFEEAERLWADVSDVAPELSEGLEEAAAKVVSLRRRPRRWLAIGALAAAAASLLIAPLAWRSAQGPEVLYRTGVGQTQAIALSDGSRIQLDSGSTLKVRLGWRARRLELAQGEATFDVAHDARRPFKVRVGEDEVKVVGTRFNISHYDRRLVVTVSRGVVEVRQDSRGAAPVARLTAGDELRHTEGAVTTLARVDPAAAFAWTEGRLDCRDKPVGEIVAYLNRRYEVPVQVSPAVAQRRFTGVLQLEDQEQLLRRLSGYLGVSLSRSQGQFNLS